MGFEHQFLLFRLTPYLTSAWLTQGTPDGGRMRPCSLRKAAPARARTSGEKEIFQPLAASLPQNFMTVSDVTLSAFKGQASARFNADIRKNASELPVVATLCVLSASAYGPPQVAG